MFLYVLHLKGKSAVHSTFNHHYYYIHNCKSAVHPTFNHHYYYLLNCKSAVHPTFNHHYYYILNCKSAVHSTFNHHYYYILVNQQYTQHSIIIIIIYLCYKTINTCNIVSSNRKLIFISITHLLLTLKVLIKLLLSLIVHNNGYPDNHCSSKHDYSSF